MSVSRRMPKFFFVSHLLHGRKKRGVQCWWWEGGKQRRCVCVCFLSFLCLRSHGRDGGGGKGRRAEGGGGGHFWVPLR